MTNFTISTDPREAGNANLIYILHLIGLAAGLTAVIGVVMAYIAKDEAPDWLKSHYENQINIFWKALLYTILSTILCIILIGFLLLLLTLVWYIVRIAKGLQAVSKGQPIAAPGSWGF